MSRETASQPVIQHAQVLHYSGWKKHIASTALVVLSEDVVQRSHLAPWSLIIISWIECENEAVWISAARRPGALSVCAVRVGVRRWLTLSTLYSTDRRPSHPSHLHNTNFLTRCLCSVSPSSLLSCPLTPLLLLLPRLRVNVGCGPAEERVLLTGLHAVADIYCENCKTTLGWKYVSVLGCFWCTAAQTALKVRGW